MRNTLITTISLFMLVLGLTSCKPYIQKCELSGFPMPQYIQDYFFVFQSGNYWIYENQDGSKRDAITVLSSKIVPECADDHFEVKFNNSLILPVVEDIPYRLNVGDGSLLFSGRDTIGIQEVWGSLSDVEVPDMIIRGQAYTTPFEVGILDENTGLWAKRFYFSKHIGIIRAIIAQDTFDLINYHLQ